MNFIDFYQSLKDGKERKTLRNKIIDATYISYPTFFGWIRRKKIPLLAQEKISQILDIPKSELFPENESSF
ncbi:MAG: hypothetical protein U0W24_07170 [Bacteroidales bacterium]